MILVCICLISLFFAILNLFLTKNDFFNPAVIFPLLFLIQGIFNIFALTYLNLEFHVEVLIILLISYLLFTIFNFINLGRRHREISGFYLDNLSVNKPIAVPKYVYYLAILLFVVVIYFQYRRLGQVAAVSGLGGASLTEKIALYDKLIKFDSKHFSTLNINLPRIVSNLSIITQAFGYLIAYKIVQNFISNKTFQMLDFSIIILLVGQMYLGGSRSPIFRLVTFIFFLFYILNLNKGYTREQMRKVLRKIVQASIVVIALFTISLTLYGRAVEYNVFHYLYIYLGAPLYNLDLFIQKYQFPVVQDYFGSQTFISFWNYWLPKHNLQSIELYLPFVRYNSTYELGNVYTTFYQFLYDFGYIGLCVLMAIISFYYTTIYRSIRISSHKNILTMTLFMYAFLFNDLIMLIFSNRFYETILNINTLKIFIAAYIIKSVLFDNSFYFGNYKIKLH